MKITDMPKIESPFIRKMVGNDYLVTDEITPGMEWVFNDDSVLATEKLNGTNVSIVIQEGIVTQVYNRTERIPFINKGKSWIIKGLLNSKEKGYLEFLGDGQFFGELIGPKVNGNPLQLTEHLWIPFQTYCQKHLAYKSWGKYPKDFETISNWFKDDIFSLFVRRRTGEVVKPEGIVFIQPSTGRMAKIRCDMFPFFTGRRH